MQGKTASGRFRPGKKPSQKKSSAVWTTRVKVESTEQAQAAEIARLKAKLFDAENRLKKEKALSKNLQTKCKLSEQKINKMKTHHKNQCEE